MDPERLRELLAELEFKLRTAGITGGMTVIGGSAMALLYPDNDTVRFTRDVDALYWPKEAVDKVAAEMAAEHKLPKNWLNDSGVPFMPSTPKPTSGQFEIHPVDVRDLIAMKLASSREQDLRDLEILTEETGVVSADELVDIAFERYGEASIPLNLPREEYLGIAKDVLRRVNRRRPR